MNLYLLMEADCIIHSAGASECAGNRMYDGWPRWRSSPLSPLGSSSIYLFIYLFSHSARRSKKLWICFKAAAAAEECLAALANAPTSSLSSAWLALEPTSGAGFHTPSVGFSLVFCVCEKTNHPESIHPFCYF